MAGPILLGDADGQVKLIRSRDEMSGLEQVLMDLGHDASGTGTFLRDRVEDSSTGAGISDDKLLELAEWTYKNVEEVWSGRPQASLPQACRRPTPQTLHRV